MVTLFLGAYFKLRPLNRIIYCLAGIAIAVLLNLARAFSLSFLKVKGKGEWLEQPLFTIAGWEASNLHDLAGWIETGTIFLLVLLLGRMATFGYFSRALGNQTISWSNLKASPPLPFSIGSILLVMGTVFFTEFHYRKTESKMQDLPSLHLKLDDPEIHIEEQSISRQVAAQLHYVDARSIQWQDRFRLRPSPFGFVLNPESEYWQAFECNWDSGGHARLCFQRITRNHAFLNRSRSNQSSTREPSLNDTRPDRRPRSYVRSLRIRPRLANYLYFVVFGPTNCLLEPRIHFHLVVMTSRDASKRHWREKEMSEEPCWP